MRILTIIAMCAAASACSQAEQDKAQHQANVAASEIKQAAETVANDPDVKAAASSAKEAAKDAGNELKEAAKDAGNQIKQAGDASNDQAAAGHAGGDAKR